MYRTKKLLKQIYTSKIFIGFEELTVLTPNMRK